jgi:hypothetical protein
MRLDQYMHGDLPANLLASTCRLHGMDDFRKGTRALDLGDREVGDDVPGTSDDLLDVVLAVGALGVVNAHPRTPMGVLFTAEQFDHEVGVGALFASWRTIFQVQSDIEAPSAFGLQAQSLPHASFRASIVVARWQHGERIPTRVESP